MENGRQERISLKKMKDEGHTAFEKNYETVISSASSVSYGLGLYPIPSSILSLSSGSTYISSSLGSVFDSLY